MLRDLCNWIVTTPVSIYLQNLKNMVPVVQTLHLVAIAAVFSSAAMIDLRVLRLISKDRPLQSIFSRFEPGIWMGLVGLLLTGLLLIIAEPARSLLALQFQVKMVLVLCGVAVTLVLRRAMKDRPDRDGSSPVSAQILAGTSLVIWMCIIFAGRWIAYA